MDWIQSNWKWVVLAFGWVVGAVKKVQLWVKENEDPIKDIVLRIEKDRQDGWTREEKKALAKDTYKKYVSQQIPWYARWVVKMIVMPKIDKLIDKFCADSKEFKEDMPK